MAQNSEILGIIKDEKGEPMTGATVVIAPKTGGTKKTTTTDNAGKFSLSGLDAQVPYLITVSYVGYKTKVIENFTLKSATEQSSLIIQLESNSDLEQVVVVGYGSNTKRNLIQNVSSIDAKQVVEIPTATLSQSLAGRMPGLMVTQSGGKPGKSSTIRVRAYDGFGGSQPPLFVIDGVISDQFAFDGLDPSEVENISVLKDGASAAAYGVRGANGVVVVKSKRGIAGPPRINLISSYSIDEATIQPKTLSAYDEAVYSNDYIRYTNLDPNGYLTDSRYYADDELDYWKHNDINLVDQYYKRPTEYRTSLNVSGGTDRIGYFVGGSYYKGTGSFDNVDYQKYNLRAKLEANVTKDLSVSLNLTTDIRNDQKPYWEYDSDNDDMPNLYQGLLSRGRMAPDYINVAGVDYPVGNLMKWHPGEVINGHTGYNRKKWSNYQALIEAKYNLSSLVDGLSLRASFANYTRHDFRKSLNQPYKLYIFNKLGSKNHLVGDQIDFTKTETRNDGNILREAYNSSNFYQLNFYIDYNKSFGQHNISATAVYEQSETNNDSFNASNQFILSPELDQLSLASSDPTQYGLGGSEFDDGRLATFARLGYNYAGKYLLEAGMRYEGSRYFIPNNRFAFFPSVSLGWRISDESFFKNNVKFVNDLKFRASIGFTGAEPDGGVLQWSQSYRKASGALFGGVSNGLSLGTYPNEEITWAKKRSIDFGFDATLFDNSLTLSAARFMNKRKDILGNIGASVPTTWGASYPLINFGAMESNGYEFTVGYRKAVNDNLSFSASVNYSYAVNKQIRINQAINTRDYQNQIGRPTGGIMGYIVTGMIRTQADIDAAGLFNGQKYRLGMHTYKDIRSATGDTPDGNIDGNDQEFIGKYSTPPAIYGLNLGTRWKTFSIDVLVQGAGNHYKLRQQLNNAQYGSPEAGSAEFWRDHWTPENPNAVYPLWPGNSASTFWLDNASFIRLKNVNIGYGLPAGVVSKAGFKDIRLFLNGSNLFLFKNETKYYDPESQFLAYPLNRNVTFGINVTL
ncbi:SusC/RagA family TonB-linked outer membrane protein [Pedobacter frigoris]|uniref:SusC/RagA family TonB-linked outer membrane protein n=1 Tax=Pedobacter frigoris TaxID=2571272 RepID=UPI0029304955|nr:SusC/RagA family TonB-linked outer membrane protein [Pedobacter frigoris]